MRGDASGDAVAIQLLNNKLEAIADEMMYTLVRTSRSTAVVHEYDCSAALLDAEGRLLAQGHASAGHMGAMRVVVPTILEKFGSEIFKGDVFVVNDPRQGGMHLPDIFCIRPIFFANRLLAFSGTLVHHLDIGGRSPGGVAPDSQSIFEEGLAIPVVRLYQRGRLNRSVADIIAANVRVPEVVLGDLQGQVAACRSGERAMVELAKEYGTESLTESFAELFAYCERLARSAIALWPDGTHHFEDFLDDDGVDPHPVRFAAKVTIAGDNVEIDFDGTADQVKGAFNGSIAHTIACAMIPVRFALQQDLPSNDGYFRPVTVRVPLGSIGNPRHPAARGARGATGRRLEEVVLGALAHALPGRLPACPAGDVTMLRFAHTDELGVSSVVSDNVWGVPGGRPDSDGPDGLATSGRGITNVPIEALERSYPIRVLRYGYVPGTGGPGKFRGGLAIEREWEILGDGVRCTIRSDRRRFPPWGLAGGGFGASSTNELVGVDGVPQQLPTKVNMLLHRGDRLLHRTAGGGGYGDPGERDPDTLEADLRLGKIQSDQALAQYGVDVGGVDPTRPRVERQRSRCR